MKSYIKNVIKVIQKSNDRFNKWKFETLTPYISGSSGI